MNKLSAQQCAQIIGMMVEGMGSRVRRIAIVSLCLLLAGCFEDRGALVAECQLKYKDVQDDVITCMRTKGFNFEERWITENGIRTPNAACYQEAYDDKGQIFPSMNGRYQVPSCYHKVMFWDAVLGKE